MALYKTVTLSDDAAEARAKFNEMLNAPYVRLVVFGNRPGTENFIAEADQAAEGPNPSPKRVIWARNPSHILGVVNALSNKSGSAITADTFSLSISANKEIRYIIPGNVLNASAGDIREELFTAYLSAGTI